MHQGHEQMVKLEVGRAAGGSPPSVGGILTAVTLKKIVRLLRGLRRQHSASGEEDHRCLCGLNIEGWGQAALGMPSTAVQIRFPGAVCPCGPCAILSFPPWGTDKGVLSRPRASGEGIREKSNSGSLPTPFLLKVNNKCRSHVKCVLFHLD